MSETRKISSPFPDRYDPNPSFAFFRIEGELIWKDFGRSTKNCGDCISFVGELFGLSRQKAADKIYADFISSGGTTNIIRKTQRTKQKGARYTNLKDYEAQYFQQYHLEKEDLQHFNIYSNAGFWSNEKCIVYSKPNQPSFIYYYNKESYKVYTPGSDIKFFSHNITDVVEGYDQLEGGGVDWKLVMCSGLKDAMVVWKIGRIYELKIDVIAPTTERARNAVYDRLKLLKSRYTNMYSLMDFDSTGWKSMDEWKDHFNPIKIEPSWNQIMIKDVAEVAKHQGMYYLREKLEL